MARKKVGRGVTLYPAEDTMLSEIMHATDPATPDRSNVNGRLIRGAYELRVLLGTQRPGEIPAEEYEGWAVRVGMVDRATYERLRSRAA